MSDPKELFSGHSHSFDTGIAKSLGLHAAVVLHHITYWLQMNKAKGINLIDEQTWMYETQQQISDFLEYMTFDEVNKAITKLLKSGILIKGNYNKNPFDKTAWYTLWDQEKIGIKKSNSKSPYSDIENAAKRHPSSPMATSLYIEKEQHKEPPPPSSKEKKGGGGGGLENAEKTRALLENIKHLPFKLSKPKTLKLCQEFGHEIVGSQINALTERSLEGIKFIDFVLAKNCSEAYDCKQFMENKE